MQRLICYAFALLVLCFVTTAPAWGSFGIDGKVTTTIKNGDNENFCLVMQPDGKLVTGGYAIEVSVSNNLCLARYNSDGSLDNTFGAGGTTTTAVGTSFSRAKDLVLQPDGKIVVVGTAIQGNQQLMMARFLADGDLDTGFGNNGTTLTANFYSSEGRALARQTDGKLIAAGSINNGGSTSAFYLARFNIDGTLDSTFGVNGTTKTAIGSGAYTLADEVLVQPDGKIVAGGNATVNNFCLVRYQTDGTVDTTFGDNGVVITAVGTNTCGLLGLIRLDNGKLVAAGYAQNGGSDNDFALVRYNADGSLDNTFGYNGVTITTISTEHDSANALAVLTDGKLVAGGFAGDGGGNLLYCMVRYQANGGLDSTFGTGGIVTTAVHGQDDEAYDLVLQPDDKLVLAGACYNTGRSDYDFGLARYYPDGTLDNYDPTPTPTATVTATATPGGSSNLNPSPDQLIVFPQPARDVVHLAFQYSGSEAVQYDVFTIAGERVLHGESVPEDGDSYAVAEIKTDHLAVGVYIVKLRINDGEVQKTLRQKIVITR